MKLYQVGLYRAVLRNEPAVARVCLGHILKTLGLTEYMRWKMMVVCSATAFYRMHELLEPLSGKMLWRFVYNLCVAPKARDAFALAWLYMNPPTSKPYELGFFERYTSRTAPDVPTTKEDRILCDAALFLSHTRSQFTEFETVEPPQVDNVKVLPQWAVMERADIPIEGAVGEACYQLFIAEYTPNVEIMGPTIFQLSPTDNLLFSHFMATQCKLANLTFEEVYRTWQEYTNESANRSGTTR